ncbi:heme/hemin ABC transporter substrate-binding protein [Chelatococcus composti]|jgi:ABC-type hemin transport system, periplasmic component|uniref:Iron complex transport system substrate-binding protein n=1 Tax=Chelatococcus composti TaxID=1743235 RepID=A0A841K918_9HYPH|nr:ABC transporter substrate-binding protein [Chelatococcus composti]MBB6168997.1 iron complex transport system substrate-binding protein [Chelatococcus composti]MBS7737599.1 ABC transporter substrate-binding protein [Chelatococcus composti]GGG44472.1 hemin ABC transporter substrate-binding protein [Chelatococcus composti]
MTGRPNRSLSRRTLARLIAIAFLLAPGPAALAQAGDPPGGNRIVALGGAVTEILYALGLEARVAAVDTTSTFPERALKEKPNVGYVRSLSAEGIIALNPTQVIAISTAGPPDAVRLIEETGVPFTQLPDEPSAEGVIHKIETIGRLTGTEAKAEALAAEVRRGFADLAAARERIDKPVKALFVLAMQNGRPLVGGRGTSADAILRLAGAENAATVIEGFKPMTDEAIIAAAPDVIVMMSNGGHAAGHAEEVFAAPAFAGTPAARDRALVTLDGQLMLGFGPRAPQAAAELMRAFYPTLATGEKAQ